MEDNGNYYLKSIIGRSGVAPTQGIPPISQQNNSSFIEDTPFKGYRSTGPLTGGFFEGSSKYDENIGSVERMISEDLTSDETRGELQTTINRLGNALFNNAVIAGTTAVSGTLGVAVGLLDALSNGEFNRLYDNAVNREMLKWQEGVAKIAPNYYTKDYENSSIWNKLGTSIFWADLIKNLGYAEGMMIPGAGVSKLLNGVPRAAQIIGSSMYSSLSEASIEALGAKQDKVAVENQIAYDSYQKAIANGEDVNLAKEKYLNAINTIENNANSAGNFVFGYNTALLTLTNSLEWGKLFSRGNTFSRRKMLEQARKEGIDVVTDDVRLPKLATDSKLWQTTKNVATRLGKASTEGIEEAMQSIGVSAADLNPSYNDFNEHIYNTEHRELASNMIQSIGMAFSEAMKDPETYTNFAMGFFTGALGIPTLQNPKTDSGYRSPIAFEGGLKEFIEEQRAYNKKVRLVNEVNSRIEQNDSFKEYYKGLVRNLILEDKANVALELNDVFNFNNTKNAQLITDVIMFDNVGHIDVLRDIIEKATSFTDEEIQELVSQGVFEDNGNKSSIENAKNKIAENAKKLDAVLTEYLNDKALIESQKGDVFSKEALENILYAKSQIRDWHNRETIILDEIYEQYSNLNEDHLNKIDFITAVKNSSDFRKDLKTLNSEELTADVAEDLNRKIEDISKMENAISEFVTKINEYWESPNKANGAIDKIKQKAVESTKNKKIKSLKDKLGGISSVTELKSFIDSTQDENLNNALNELATEKNLIVLEYNKINSESANIEAKIRESKEEQQAIEDALTLLNNATLKSENAEQLKDLQSELYNDTSLLGEAGSPLAQERLDKAKVVLNQAINSSSEESSDNNSVMDMTIPDILDSIETDAPDPITDSMEVGNSGVTQAPPVNINTTEASTEEIKDLDIFPSDNSSPEDIQSESEEDVEFLTDKDEDNWNPAISEYHRPSLKKGKYISTAKADGMFKDVWTYLWQHKAFDFVNKGNLKVGDTLYFGLVLDSNSQMIKNSVFVYTKTDVGYQVLNTLYLTKAEKDLKNAILEEYKNSEKQEGQTLFISSYTSKVAELKSGVIPQDSTLRPLKQSMEGTSINPSNVVFSVIKGVKKETGNFKDSNNEITLPSEIGKKNGWTYIEIPNVKRGNAGGRTAMPLFVTDYGKTNSNFENTNINNRIQNAIRSIATATTYEELKEAFGKLQKDLTTKKLALFLTPEGNIRINERLFDSAGKPITEEINGKKVESQVPHTIFKTNRDGSPKSVEAIIAEIDTLLKSMNLRFRTNAEYINTSSYNQELIDSDILSSYLIKTEERNAWFTIEPVDLEGKPTEVVTEASTQPVEQGLKETSIETTDLDLNNLMSEFGGEIEGPTQPDIEYKSTINVVDRNETSINTEELFKYWHRTLRKSIERDSTFDTFEEAVYHITDARDTDFKQSLQYIKNVIESDVRYKDLKQFLSTSITNENIKVLLNNGYSQEDINKMSPEELQQAKQCLGF